MRLGSLLLLLAQLRQFGLERLFALHSLRFVARQCLLVGVESLVGRLQQRHGFGQRAVLGGQLLLHLLGGSF